MISTAHIIFYVFAVIAVVSAVAVISVRNPVHSVLSLVITFFAMSGIWMTLYAEFLSLILLLVYVGAVMTLFLFVVMMLNVDTEKKQSGFVRYLPFGVIIVLLMTGLMLTAVGPQYFGIAEVPAPAPLPADASNTRTLGMVLYTVYAYPFQVAGTLLLSVIVAAITLTHRGPRKRRVQDVSAQVFVRPEDRIRIVKMPVEPRQEGNS